MNVIHTLYIKNHSKWDKNPEGVTVSYSCDTVYRFECRSSNRDVKRHLKEAYSSEPNVCLKLDAKSETGLVSSVMCRTIKDVKFHKILEFSSLNSVPLLSFLNLTRLQTCTMKIRCDTDAECVSELVKTVPTLGSLTLYNDNGWQSRKSDKFASIVTTMCRDIVQYSYLWNFNFDVRIIKDIDSRYEIMFMFYYDLDVLPNLFYCGEGMRTLDMFDERFSEFCSDYENYLVARDLSELKAFVECDEHFYEEKLDNGYMGSDVRRPDNLDEFGYDVEVIDREYHFPFVMVDRGVPQGFIYCVVQFL